jgi:small nuclear ribonucleoprotein (snRNP)-like protein
MVPPPGPVCPCFRLISHTLTHPNTNTRAHVQLPLSLLKTAQGHPMLVELKNGDTYNGRLVSCDTWMNITLRDVICTSRVRFVLGVCG